MVTIEVFCRGSFHLVEAFREGIANDELKSFTLRKGASRARSRAEILHKSPRTPGKVKLEQRGSVCLAKVTAPAGKEWDILHKFIGRIAHRFAANVQELRIVFPEPKRRR